jgi:signal transduction histidine kinase
MTHSGSDPDRAGAAARRRSARAGSARVRRRDLLAAIDRFFAQRAPGVCVAVSTLVTGAIFSADVAIGRKLSPSLFYLLPVALMTSRLGRRGGIAAAAAASCTWTVSDLVKHVYGADAVAPWWNLGVRFAVLSIVASLLATIAESMRSERDLADRAMGAADELRTLNDVKDTLLHAISHDLRGPIAAIVGSARSLERRRQLDIDPSDEDALLSGILQSGRKLDRLVGDLLDLERLDRGVLEPDRSPTELGALVSRIVDEAMYADRHPIHVEVLEPIEMDIDAGTIERVVENLLVNAVKHTAERTPIHVRVERCDGGALVSVEDEGPGVPDAIKTAIFEPFRQGADVRTGVGIGLSLVARFAALHGGSAWVEDRFGGGAAFRVFLPGETRAVRMAQARSARV